MDIVDAILKRVEDPYGRPTDIIGFGSSGRKIADALLPVVGQKEICFFDENVKSDSVFHYLDFADMLEKTEIMIFTTELPSRHYGKLSKLNKKATIFIPKSLAKTVSVLEEKQYGDNLVIL